ncbi:Urocortin-3 [Heterocephalus glaber]|uniref:Urocortin-3 n=1 Tax=Heterocephalus glaber TaxID=10181 RepID=G5C4E0_HETGA|nr:urocortin-3 [Heterocephalus glaber]EHB16401.1 Urocortin-3 [Heterocephalus glaber]
MLMPAPFLLLLLLLLGDPTMGLSRRFYKAGPVFSFLNTALSELKQNGMEDAPLLSKKSFHYLPSQDPSSRAAAEGNQDKDRTFPGSGGGVGSTRYKYLSRAPQRKKLHQDKGRSGQRSKFTLSLDVPTDIMNILFNIARAKDSRARAAVNAQLMAQIGRKK